MNDVTDYDLVSLLFSTVSIVDLEQVNICWTALNSKTDNNLCPNYSKSYMFYRSYQLKTRLIQH